MWRQWFQGWPVRRQLGRMGGALAAGPGGKCVCPECGAEVEHDTGEPCYDKVCPKCGAKMTRAEDASEAD
jgi:predicted amidophosphoribosyltransferase